MADDISTLLQGADLLFDTMQLQEARTRFEEITILYPEHPEPWAKLCRLYTIQGNHQKALSCCRESVRLQPNEESAWAALAAAQVCVGHHREAAETYARLTNLHPDSVEYSYSRAIALLSSNQLEKAHDALQWTLQIDAGHIDCRINLGILEHHKGNYTAAEKLFREVINTKPDSAVAHCKLGSTLQAIGKYKEAIEYFDIAISLHPSLLEAHFCRATVLVLTDQSGQAVTSLKEVIRLDPMNVGAYVNLATSLLAAGEANEAMNYCKHALSMEPHNTTAISLAATIEHRSGNTQEAIKRLRKWIHVDIPDPNIVISYAEASMRADTRKQAIELISQVINRRKDLHASIKCLMHFNLGRLYDKEKEFDLAFEHFRIGNMLKGVRYDPTSTRQLFNATINTNNRRTLQSAQCSESDSTQPVFVVGMPRSGTSLVEQILASHPEVHGAGELDEIPKILKRITDLPGGPNIYPGCVAHLDRETLTDLSEQYLTRLNNISMNATRIIDKAPGNFRFLGLISLLFPKARVIHCIRNPLDTILSCYFQNFVGHHQPFCYDLDHLAEYYQDYLDLMAHWKSSVNIPIHDVIYEDIIEKQVTVTRRLLEFCGLGWHEDCLAFHKSDRFVSTSSYDQVRQPLYRSSMARWRNYKKHLGGLVEKFESDHRSD